MAIDPVDTLQPVLRRVLFWDVPLDNIDVHEHADWLIARVLWRGALDDVRRIIRAYGARRVAAVALRHAGLPAAFRPFWLQVLSEEVRALHPETLAPPVQSVLMEHGQTLLSRGGTHHGALGPHTQDSWPLRVFLQGSPSGAPSLG